MYQVAPGTIFPASDKRTASNRVSQQLVIQRAVSSQSDSKTIEVRDSKPETSLSD